FAERGLPKRLDPHPRRGGSQGSKVGNDLLVVSKLAVRPHFEAEELGGGLDGSGVGGSGDEKEEREEDAFHAPRIMAQGRAVVILVPLLTINFSEERIDHALRRSRL